MGSRPAEIERSALCERCGERPRAVVKHRGRRVRLKLCKPCVSLVKSDSSKAGHTGRNGHTKALCGAKTRSSVRNKTCTRLAGHGTDHLGFGRCKYHGGSTTKHRRAAYMKMAKADFESYNKSVSIHPHEALIWCVEHEARELVWLRQVNEAFSIEEVSVKDSQAHVLAQMQSQSAQNLAKYSKMALEAGVDERMVRVAERTGEVIVKFSEHLLAGLQLSETQRAMVPGLMRESLQLIEGRAVEKEPA